MSKVTVAQDYQKHDCLNVFPCRPVYIDMVLSLTIEDLTQTINL